MWQDPQDRKVQEALRVPRAQRGSTAFRALLARRVQQGQQGHRVPWARLGPFWRMERG